MMAAGQSRFATSISSGAMQDQSRDNVAAAGRAFIAEIRSALDALDPGEKS
jgi:hypothetical protein